MSININGSKGISQNTTEVTKIPVGTTAQRPDTPEAGMIRFNTDEGFIEGWDAAANEWRDLNKITGVAATGGTVTDITQDGKQYRVHTFTSSGTFEVTRGGEVECLVVAGGGAGGVGFGGGGGAGGMLEGSTNVDFGQYGVIVGEGAPRRTTAGTGESGQDSSVFDVSTTGGGGGGGSAAAGNGGSGGGASGTNSAGTGIVGQGNNGGSALSNSGAGGGGADEVGQNNPPDGGDGRSSTITGATVFYAGGGASGVLNGNIVSASGGVGGGGSVEPSQPAENGTSGLGGGGGGSVDSNGSGAGGSGIVIVRYRIG